MGYDKDFEKHAEERRQLQRQWQKKRRIKKAIGFGILALAIITIAFLACPGHGLERLLMALGMMLVPVGLTALIVVSIFLIGDD